MTYLQPRQLYPKPHEIFGKEYMLDNSPSDSKRVQWDSDKVRTLLEVIKHVNNGDFLKLLKQPLEEKKKQMQTLKMGWDMVRRIMLRKYPDFSLTRVQLSDKWRKLHCNKTSDPSQEFPKKTTDELLREFNVIDEDGEDMVHVGLSGEPITEPVITVNMDYPEHEDGVDPGQSSPPLGARAKTTEEVIAEIENEEYVPPPPSKGKKKYVKFSEVEGRTPVECKRIELMVREHKARMVREGEIFHYERRIKQKKLEILELLKSKLENQQSVNLDVLTM